MGRLVYEVDILITYDNIACVESSFHWYKAVFTISSVIVEKKIGIFIKNISDSEFSERELCELADFIYFCLLILSTLSDGSTLSRETTHLKLMSTAVEEVRGSTNAVLMSN